MATQARTVTVNVTTLWHEEDDSETTTYAFSTTATKDDVGQAFIAALKDAVKEWAATDPDDVEAPFEFPTGDREDYDSTEEYILSEFTSRMIAYVPANILANHGITEAKPAAYLDFDEFDKLFK